MSKVFKLAALSGAVWLLLNHGVVSAEASEETSVEENAQVLVTMNDQFVVSFDQSVRLNQVLEQANTVLQQPDIYWPVARLGVVNDEEFTRFYQTVLADFEEAAEQNESLIPALREFRRMEFIYQPFHQIDLAKARQAIRYNPLLQPGDYQLILPPRPDSLYVFGAVDTTHRLHLEPGMTVSAYVRALHKAGHISSSANPDYVYLVRNGETHKIGWGLYNADGVEAQPGDVVWIGFDTQYLPWPEHKHRNLNNQIAQVLGNLSAYPDVEPTYLPVDIPAPNHWSRLENHVSRTNYGGIGLLQTPTARMAEKGDVALSYSDMQEYYRYTVSLQLFDWLETNAFYVRIPNRLYSDVPGFSGDTIYTDKGFDVKARLWQERNWLPEVSVGLRDFAGTGLFDGEYIVANKRFGAFDFSLGLGFGRLGTRDSIGNPFCQVADRFCDRPEGFTRGGGQFEYDQWFRGPAALFGGVQWQSPWQPLTVMLEYDGNDYSTDNAGVDIEPRTPLNVGINYRAFDWLDLQAGYERGDTFTFNITLHTNLNTLNQHRVEPRKIEPGIQPQNETLQEVDWDGLSSRLRESYAVHGIRYHGEDEEVSIYMAPYRYRDIDERMDRATRIVADELPSSVKRYQFVHQMFDDAITTTEVDADAFKARIRHEELGSLPDDTSDLFVRREPDSIPADDDANWLHNPEYQRYYSGYGMKPFFNQDFGSPEDFHIYQLGLHVFGRTWIGNNLELFAQGGINLANNYDKFNYIDDDRNNLPPVRTNVRNYVQADTWLDVAQATYYHKLSNGLYGMVYGGYLERMYGGIGGEILYRPVDSRWAFGLDINRVKQRNYTGGTGFLDYMTTTGYFSVYYQVPWLDDSLLQLDFGQFLAKDHGVNITFQKRFESGVTVGAYAALTDVSQEDYGEGRFTKGFFISIPFDLIGVRPTRQRVGIHWIPLARNGGRQLIRRNTLYGITDDVSPFYHR